MHVRKIGSRKLYFSPVRLAFVALRAMVLLARAVQKSSADWLQVCKPLPLNLPAALLGQQGRRIVCDCDDYEAATNRFSTPGQRAVVKYFEDDVVRWAQALTVNTRFMYRHYQDLGFPRARLFWVPNGVERSRFSQPIETSKLRQRLSLDVDQPVIIYVGTLSRHSHAVDLLLNAFQSVVRHIPGVRLLLIGGGEDFDNLQERARGMGLQGNAHFAGRVTPEAIPAYFALATVSVDPVNDDLIARARSPLKIVESQALGVPVVTGDVGDRRWMLHEGESGMLVAPGDAEALAEGLLTLLDSPKRRAEMTRVALARREAWYWDRLVLRFLEAYE
jgi:glycosyltransferase involved in cell wall biosynthesis